MDIFSRYIVGWMVATRENAKLAQAFINETVEKYAIDPTGLTIHSDRGSPMTAKSTSQLHADLGVLKSLSRPQVSNDNPFSEATFKTIKYSAGFPDRFANIQEARAFAIEFFAWYNKEHHHDGLESFTPEMVHFGLVEQIAKQRQEVLNKAYLANRVWRPFNVLTIRLNMLLTELYGSTPKPRANSHLRQFYARTVPSVLRYETKS